MYNIQTIYIQHIYIMHIHNHIFLHTIFYILYCSYIHHIEYITVSYYCSTLTSFSNLLVPMQKLYYCYLLAIPFTIAANNYPHTAQTINQDTFITLTLFSKADSIGFSAEDGAVTSELAADAGAVVVDLSDFDDFLLASRPIAPS